MTDNPGGPPEWAKNLGLFSIIIGEIIGYTGAGVGIGYAAHHFAGGPVWLMAPGGVIGLALAFWQINRISRRFR